MPYDCFISYASEDLRFAEELHRRLAAEGFSVWFDKARLVAGEDWHARIEAASRDSQVLIPVLTPRWGRSEWTRFETYGAVAVIPVLAEGRPEDVVPEPLRRIQAQVLDFSAAERCDWPGLFGAIREKLRDARRRPAAEGRPQNLPYVSLGSLYKGRDGMLARLREHLLDGASPGHGTVLAPAQVLHGLGGVGKTRLAVEFAWRHQECFSALLFVAADSAADLRTNLASLAGPMVLDLRLREDETDEVRLAAALRWLSEHPVWCLIIDNVDTEDAAAEVERLLGQLRGGRLLITSRIAHWSAMVEPLMLDVLAEEDARDFLLARTDAERIATPADAEEAGALARELDGLALALEQAGAYVSKRRMRLADYRQRLHQKTPEVLGWYDPRLMAYKKSVAVTWQATFEQVSAPARDLLRLLAWLAPDPIPLLLLEADRASSDERIDALIELEGFSLARRGVEGTTVVVHRLVQEITREREQAAGSAAGGTGAAATAPHGTAPAGLTAALSLLNEALPDDPTNRRGWPEWSVLHPHVAAVTAHADACAIARPTARLAHGLGAFLFGKALYAEAERHLRRAVALDERTLGEDHPDVARDLAGLCRVLRDTRRLDEAATAIDRALGIDEAAAPQDPLAVARDLMERGEVLFSAGRLAEREPLYRRALAIREQHWGPLHHDVAESMNNLASALQDLDEVAEAEQYYVKCLAIGASVLPPDDLALAIWTNNLASLFQQTGRHDEAEAAYRRAIAIFEAGTVPDHPHLATALDNLASALLRSGRRDDARQALTRALGIRDRYLGPDHPHTLALVRKLLQLVFDLRDVTSALPLVRRAVGALSVGNDGTNTPELAILDSLTALVEGTDDLGTAEAYRALVVEARERTRGDSHPATIAALNSLAKLQERRGDWDGAEATYLTALSRAASDVVVRGNYAFLLLHARRDVARARQAYDRALADNPGDAVNLTNCAGLCLVTGDLAAAEALLVRARTRVLPAPDAYSGRTFFLRAAVAALNGEHPGRFLGQLHTLFDAGVGHAPWLASAVTDALETRLPEADRAIFRAVFQAVNGSSFVRALGTFAAWQAQAPVPLNHPWTDA